MTSSSKLWSDLSFLAQLNPLFSMASSCRLWSNLPEDLLELIFEDLTDFFDLLRCRTVCQPWRSAANKVIHNNLKTPLLLLPPKLTISQEYAKLLLSTSKKSPGTTKYTPLTLPTASLEPAVNPRTTDGYSWQTRKTLVRFISITPSRPFIYNFHCCQRDPTPLQFIMSNSPDDQDCSVLVLYDHLSSHNGCVCKPGDNKWRKIIINMGKYEDMIYYHGELYAIDTHGKLLRLKYDVGDCIEEEEVSTRAIYGSRLSRYLAESRVGDGGEAFGVMEDHLSTGLQIGLW